MTTVRPLRQDAARNRERLVLAARDVFRRRGLNGTMDEIARSAGVAIGTLYNRFPTRGELVDAALGPVAQRAVEITERSLLVPDPWEAFASFFEGTCELFVSDRGFADACRSDVPGTPVLDAAKRRLNRLKDTIVVRAKRAGALRADVETADIALATWGIAAIVDATREIAPDAWRRQLALVLDGLRAGAAHPLPAPAMTFQQLIRAQPR